MPGAVGGRRRLAAPPPSGAAGPPGGWSQRRRGITIVGAGVVALSPDSLLIRLLTVSDATVIFFRGVAASIGYVALAGWQPGGAVASRGWAIGRSGLLVSCLSAVGNACFVLSIRHTAAAHALLIFAAAPMWTSLVSWAIGREPVARETLVAAAFLLVGVGGIFLTGPRGGELNGDAFALAGSLALATMLAVVRRSPSLPTNQCLAVGGVLTAMLGAPWAAPSSLTASDAAIVFGFGSLVLPGALVLITSGPRFLPAPEVSLLLLLETVLGPLWVWLALAEAPTNAALSSGALILGTLAAHTLWTRAGSSAVPPPAAHGPPRPPGEAL